MSHSSGGVIHLDESDADVEEVVGSDVEEVVTWDHELRGTKTRGMSSHLLASPTTTTTTTTGVATQGSSRGLRPTGVASTHA
jgi:hypothetical protein